MKAYLFFVSIFCISSISSASESSVTPAQPVEGRTYETSSETKNSWFSMQHEKLMARRKALAEVQRNTKFCAYPTYARGDGKYVVVSEGHCDKGGFGEHGEANVRLSTSERISRH